MMLFEILINPTLISHAQQFNQHIVLEMKYYFDATLQYNFNESLILLYNLKHKKMEKYIFITHKALGYIISFNSIIDYIKHVDPKLCEFHANNRW